MDTLILSDVHLGSEVSRAREASELLAETNFRRLVLLGDIFSDLNFRRLTSDHWKFLSRIRKLSNPKRKVEVVWVEGNHDQGLSQDHVAPGGRAGLSALCVGVRGQAPCGGARTPVRLLLPRERVSRPLRRAHFLRTAKAGRRPQTNFALHRPREYALAAHGIHEWPRARFFTPAPGGRTASSADIPTSPRTRAATESTTTTAEAGSTPTRHISPLVSRGCEIREYEGPKYEYEPGDESAATADLFPGGERMAPPSLPGFGELRELALLRGCVTSEPFPIALAIRGGFRCRR